ncbi:MAG: hypothetical protein JW841_05090, partial [Deltaproteobacteria bacterium]|nr:hypothetical protein [Deltaproteobacteria bacterium]
REFYVTPRHSYESRNPIPIKVKNETKSQAGGAALSINLPRGKDSYVVNSTVASEGWAAIEAQCKSSL